MKQSRHQRHCRSQLSLTLCGLFVSIAAQAGSFNQTDWSGGIKSDAPTCTAASGAWAGTQCVAADPVNQTGLTIYSAADAGFAAGTDLSSAPSSAALSETSNLDFARSNNKIYHTLYADFSSGSPLLTNAKVNNGAVGIKPATLVNVWAAEPAWDVATELANDNATFGDLDGDGDMDMLVGDSGGFVTAYRNTGTDDSQVWELYPAWGLGDVVDGGYPSTSVPALGDLDGDGDLDLMVAYNGNIAKAWENAGNKNIAAFGRKSAWDRSSAVITANMKINLVDLNGDGTPELMMGGNYNGTVIEVYQFDSATPLWTQQVAWQPPNSGGGGALVAAGDLDNDGDPDLIVGWRNAANLTGYTNTGSSITPSWTQDFSGPAFATEYDYPALVDLDSDGDMDLLVGSSNGLTLYGYKNTATTYNTAATYTSTVIDVGAANAGFTTLDYSPVVPAGTTVTVDVRAGATGSPDATWTDWQIGIVSGSDISALGSRRYAQYRLNLSTTDTSLTPLIKDVTMNYVAYAETVSTTVTADKVSLALSSRTVTWDSVKTWLTTITSANSTDGNVSLQHPAVADLNGDGFLDILMGDGWTSVGLAGYRNDGTNNWIYEPSWNINYNAATQTYSALGDLDGDGDADAMIGKNGLGSVLGYENTGGIAGPPVWVAKPAWDITHGLGGANAALADLDNDGDLDAMVGHVGSPHEIYGYENKSVGAGPVWSRQTGWDLSNAKLGGSNWTKVPALADIDGDGDFDLVVGDNDASTVVLENVGNSGAPLWGVKSAWLPPALAQSHHAFADLDDDGDLDIITGISGEVSGRKNIGASVYPASGTYTSSVIDFGLNSYTTLDFGTNLRAGTSITMEARAGTTAKVGVGWTAWAPVVNGGDISALAGNQYFQYKASLNAAATALTPDLNDVTVNYTGIPSPISLTSVPYDTGVAGNYVISLDWVESLAASSDVKIQLRSAPDNAGSPGVWTDWVGPDGSNASYWNSADSHGGSCSGTGTISCATMAPLLKDGASDQWFQYQVTLVSGGGSAPTFSDVTIGYATSLPPAISLNKTTGLVTDETGGFDTFTVVLDSLPLGDVSIALSSDLPSEAAPSPATLTFTTANWNTPQLVTVNGVDDAVDDANKNYVISVNPASVLDANYHALATKTVTGSNADNDTVGITVSAPAVSISEASLSSDTFTIALNSQPLADVVIGLASSDLSEGTVSNSSITFTPGDWNIAKIITVTALDDAIDDGDVVFNIITTHASSTDILYNGMAVADASVTNVDDDTAAVVVTPLDGLVTSESGSVIRFNLVLQSEPLYDVTIGINESNPTEGKASPSSVTFTPANWNVVQVVSVGGVADGMTDGDINYSLFFSDASSADPAYNAYVIADYSLTNTDIDVASIIVTPVSGLVTTEAGDSAIFLVSLASVPSANVSLSIVSNDPSEGLVDLATLEYTGLTWATKKRIIVTGVDDLTNDGDQLFTITVAPLASGDVVYNSVAPVNVSVTNTDDDGVAYTDKGFKQTNWSGGSSTNPTSCADASGSWTSLECVALSPTNEAGWMLYQTKDAGVEIINGGEDFRALAIPSYLRHTTNADFGIATSQIHQTNFDDFSTGAVLSSTKVNPGAVSIKPLTLTAAWTAKPGWDVNAGATTNTPAFADLDNDGDVDMVVGQSDGTIEGLRNVGTETAPVWEAFQAWRMSRFFLGVWQNNAKPTLGDFDGDGDYDLFVGYGGQVIYGFENTGDKDVAIFTYRADWNLLNVAGAISRVELVDLDGTGYMDVMTGGGYTVPYIYAFSFSGGVWTRQTGWEPIAHTTANGFPTNEDSAKVAAADIDDDGDRDLLVGWRYRDELVGYTNTNNASSPIWSQNFAVPVPAGSYHLPDFVDIDSDGDLDFYMGLSADTTLYAYENTGTVYTSGATTYTSAVMDAGSHVGFLTVDFGSVVPANTTLTLDVRAGNVAVPDGTWTTWTTAVANGGDITALGTNRYVQYRANLSTMDSSVTPLLTEISFNYTVYPFGDNVIAVNDELTLEVISKTTVWTEEPAWRNSADGGSTDSNNGIPTPALGDMDGDGDLDMLRGDVWSRPGIGFYRNDGTNVWTYAPEWDLNCCAGINSTSPELVDMDSDGDLDVLMGTSGANVYAYENIGSPAAPVWAAGSPVAQKIAWNIIKDVNSLTNLGLTDLDGDGDLDALVGDSAGGNVVWGYENVGTRQFPAWAPKAAWNIYEVDCEACAWYSPSPSFSDLDADGDYDVILANNGGDRKSYAYENIGTITNPVWSRKSSWDAPTVDPVTLATMTRTHYELADLDNDGDTDLLIGGNSPTVFGYRNTGLTSYQPSGSYTSDVLQIGVHLGFTTLDYHAAIRTGTSLTVDIRAGDVLVPDGSWTAWQTTPAGADISALGSAQYVQYRVNFSANGDQSLAPSFYDISFNHAGTVSESALISNAFNTGVATAAITTLYWDEVLLAGSDVRIQLRTATDNGGVPGDWSEWTGPDGSSSSYWNSANTFAGSCTGTGSIVCTSIPAVLNNGSANQWLQYKAAVVFSGTNTSILSDITVAYTTIATSGLISVTPSSGLVTTEAGTTASFDVVLDSAPTADVSFGLLSGDLSEASVSPASLSFTSLNWATPQTVTLTGVDDAVNDGDVAYTIYTSMAVSSDAMFNHHVIADVTASNTNNDVASGGVIVSPMTTLLSTESGGSDSFSVVLANAPTQNVVFTVDTSDGTEGVVSPNLITFTSLNWSIPQVITVTGQDDVEFDGTQSYTIVTSVTASDDPNYSGLVVADLTAANSDNDSADLIYTPSSGIVLSENGGLGAFTVQLAAQPSQNVTFTLTSSDTSEGVLFGLPMTFTPTNWNQGQTVTVYGVDDSDVDGDQAFTIKSSKFTSNDGRFANIDPADMAVTNQDNESIGIKVTPYDDMQTNEDGGKAFFGVELLSRPTHDVIINMHSTNTAEGRVDAQLVIKPDDFINRGELVMVTGVDDSIVDGNVAYTIVLDPAVSADPNYNSIDPDDVAVTNVSDNIRSFDYGQLNAGLGEAASFAGDINGDGYADVVFGTPNYDSAAANAGRVQVHFGNRLGLIDVGDRWEALGDQLNGYLGHSVAAAGDVNNDGYDDLIVGAYGYDVSGTDEGRVFIYHGAATGLVATPAQTLDGTINSGHFGFSVASAGDVNKDGYADVIIGESGTDKVYLYHGSASGIGLVAAQTLIGDQAGSQFGVAVASAGDVNNDGYDDVIVGADLYDAGEIDEGRAYLYLGGASGVSATPIWNAESNQASSYFGHSVVGAADINSDGFDDLLVSAYLFGNGHTDEGRVFVYYGSGSGPAASADLTMEVNQDGAHYGYAMSAAGDVNLDGYADVVIGAKGYDNGEVDEGRVFVYGGSATGVNATPLLTFESDQVGAALGASVAGGGDFDHDRYDDIIAGANLYDAAQLDEGRAYVYRLPPSSPGVTITPTTALETSESLASVARLTMVLDAPPSADVVVELFMGDTSEGILGAGSIFTFTAANWYVPQDIVVRGVDDDLDDGHVPYQVYALVRSDDVNYNNLSLAPISLLNLNNDYSVSVVTTDASASETAGDPATFSFTRTGDTSGDLSVVYSVGGTAVNGTDFGGLGGAVTIPAGQASVSVNVVPVDDALAESVESVIVTLSDVSTYVVAANNSASIEIIDNDAPGISVSPSSALVTTEAGGTASFSIVLNTQPTDTVTIAVASDTPAEGLILPTSVSFTTANWNTAQSITVVGQDDVLLDGDVGYFIVTANAVSSDLNYAGMASSDVAVTNADNDVLPNVSVMASASNIAENTGTGFFTITRTGATTSDLNVSFSVSGSATAMTDYRAIGSVATILAGDESVLIAIAPVDDALLEGNENVQLTLLANAAYIVAPPAAAAVVIADDDQTPVPAANFALDQVSGDNKTITVDVGLGSVALVYPVTIPYAVSGTAVNHNAVSGNLVINAGVSANFTVNIGTGDAAGSTIVFTMGAPTNAILGGRNTHTITVIQENAAPEVALSVTQLGVSSHLIVTSSGDVTISAIVDDANVTDTHTYDWSLTNNQLVDIFDGDDASFVFDPSVLTDGFYKVRLAVTDNGVPAETTHVNVLLEVVAVAPSLSSLDSDMDGVTDVSESHFDTDNDGIPDYLDSSLLGDNELQQLATIADSYIMRTEVGLILRLGDVAFAAGSDSAQVSPDDIANYGAGEGDAGVASAQDTVPNTGGYFDFEILGLPKAGQSVNLVIPQLAALPNGAVYRKYDPNLGWQDFVVDGNNQIASALGLPGECPLPGDVAYSGGFTAGHHCIQLTIQDGGPNDMDGIANHVIEDPAQIVSVAAAPKPANGGGGGGASSLWWMLLVLGLMGRIARRQDQYMN